MTPSRYARYFLARALVAASIGLIIASVAQVAGAAEPLKELRLGFQKGSVNLVLLKQSGRLDQRLNGTRITWLEFPAGPQLLEALSVGSVDFGTTGDTPPIFAQAAGTQLVYVGAELPKPDISAILVRHDSPIRAVTELKGKRVAVQKGSSAHYHLLRALQLNGLQWTDITAVYLTPADARAAFERCSVDAWTIWDPYWAAAEKGLSPRVLVTGKGYTNLNSFYLAGRAFADKHPEVIQALFEELTKSDNYLRENPKAAGKVIAQYTGLDTATVDLFLSRRPRSPVVHLSEAVIDDQQGVADQFHKQGLIPKAIRVRDIVWKPSVILTKTGQ